MPELYKGMSAHEAALDEIAKMLIWQQLTRIFSLRHGKNCVADRFNPRHLFDAFRCVTVNYLAASFVFGRAITRM
jgi:hypothetical protein